MAATACAPDVGEAWTPPPFCRTSWTSETARNLWEARLDSARDALEDLTLLRSAADGRPRFAFVRPASLPRLCQIARESQVSLASLDPVVPDPHGVAAGRQGRVAVVAGSAAGRSTPPLAPQACEDRQLQDPIWRLASATPNAEALQEGLGLRVEGAWASNPLLAAIGLAPAVCWPRSFSCPDAEEEGLALSAAAEAYDYGEAFGYLREALSWPASWTALHGVAEVKTPVFRFIRNTPPTPKRLTVERPGGAMPDGGARGLGFPFAGRARRSAE